MKIPPELELSPSMVERKLVGFLREEIRKAGLKNAVFGLSGGVDSALVCCLVAKALGPENTFPVIMPSAQSRPESVEDAKSCIERLGIPKYHHVSVSPQIETYFEKEEVPESGDEAVMKNRLGNKCARERMTILYDLSVCNEALVIGTGNKTEFLLGYGTIYGDMASAINPIGDLYKMQVYQMAEYCGLPEKIINKTPSADLWSGQTDEGELGFSYYDADRLLYEMVDHGKTDDELSAIGFEMKFIERVRSLINASEFKRRMPVVANLNE